MERVQAVRKEEERIAQEEMYAEAARIEEKRAENEAHLSENHSLFAGAHYHNLFNHLVSDLAFAVLT
mgnify:CR=1 FL=1